MRLEKPLRITAMIIVAVWFLACIGTLTRIGADHLTLAMTFASAVMFTIIWKLPNK